jgi:nucleoid DNA-binding protein
MADKEATDTARAMTKTAVCQELADKTGLERKQVNEVLDALENLIKDQLGGEGPGVFSFLDLVKIRVVHKPERKAGTQPNPFKPGEMMKVEARPASTEVKAVVLKKLKEFA